MVGAIAISAPAVRGAPLPLNDASGGSRGCELTTRERDWVHGSLAAWDQIASRALLLPPARRSEIILFDRQCAYHLDPDSAQVVGQRHGGHIALPNGQVITPRALAFASLATGDSTTFLVMALRSVWESDTTLADEDWDEFLTRSFIHEMTHTRQLPLLVTRLRAAGGLVGMRDVDDDIVQERFDSSAAFRASVARETSLLYQAAMSRNGPDRRRYARQAVDVMKRRREQFFGGEAAPWAFVEQLMLDLEGAAAFAEVAYLHTRSGRQPLQDLVERVRGDAGFWSQDEGLALFLVLDALRSDWPRETFTAEPRSALDLIEDSLAGGRASAP